MSYVFQEPYEKMLMEQRRQKTNELKAGWSYGRHLIGQPSDPTFFKMQNKAWWPPRRKEKDAVLNSRTWELTSRNDVVE